MNTVITSQNSNPATILEELAKGEATVHTERENGTLRRRHYLPEGTREREIAEWVRLMRDGQEADEVEGAPAVAPRSVASLAHELHLSPAAIRRILVDLAITEEIEEAEEDELADMLTGAQEA